MIEVREAQRVDADAIATAHVEGWRAGYRGLVKDEFLDDPEFLRMRRSGWTRRLEDGPPPTGDVVIIDTWDGPVMPGLPPLTTPMHNIQYRLDLR